ncbi:histidine biosynthesis bifunctional protein hisIE, chloroplastic-like [Iris pallida]|uniref:Histidine biosynthesis bifunctional protein hisIE, chloroplastic-like n=2 Tax=Iris pallida TaxID=29817 RepID=A0AAX6EA80_IRIPA|nr:histidine biosynthesis bifunctional protein hisIE, chloroplastic-like [Iris pallida]
MAATSSNGLSSLSFRPGLGLRRKNQKLVAAISVNASYRNSSGELPLEPKVGALLDTVKWDNKGLAVAIAQNVDTGSILMQGFANKEALAMTISSRKATFYSRSRSSLWTKGATSSNFINVHDIFLDCDRDSIIYLGKPDGPTCHTGSETCYYSSLFDLLEEPQASKERLASTTLYSLEATISQRKDEAEEALQNGKPSWTKRLLLDRELLSSKVSEEAGELVQTLLENEDRSHTASEMADLLYHSMVLLRVKGVVVEEVLEVLRKRFSESGIEEKSRRQRPNYPS